MAVKRNLTVIADGYFKTSLSLLIWPVAVAGPSRTAASGPSEIIVSNLPESLLPVFPGSMLQGFPNRFSQTFSTGIHISQ